MLLTSHNFFCTERRLCLAGQARGKALARRDFLGLGVGAQTSVQTPGVGTGSQLRSMQAPPQEGGTAPYCTGAVSGLLLGTGGWRGAGMGGGGGRASGASLVHVAYEPQLAQYTCSHYVLF